MGENIDKLSSLDCLENKTVVNYRIRVRILRGETLITSIVFSGIQQPHVRIYLTQECSFQSQLEPLN